MAPVRRILSIDGGGVRGVIPTAALVALERAMGGRVRDHFDFVAGTSTGALIAGAVAAGMPAERVVRLYRDQAPPLFRRMPLLSTLQRLVFGRMYDVRELRRLIGEALTEVGAESWTLNDVPCDVMVTAKGLDDGHQWYFVKDEPGTNTARTGQLRLADCLTASAAAPTYFAPWVVSGLESAGPMVDGGTGVAGNPVYQACVEAFLYSRGYEPASTVIVSLGTGHFFDRPRPTWLYSWLGWILAELLRSPGEQQTELVDRHFADAAFYRIDVRLPREFGLDDAARIEELHAIGERLAAEIDWPAVLRGEDRRWAVTRRRRRAEAYAREV
ncbi:MAG TPA: patatin-like phospholipase family protein [Candidatus Limnocylindria bacterium]